MRRPLKPEELDLLIHIQALTCDAQCLFLRTPQKSMLQTRSPLPQRSSSRAPPTSIPSPLPQREKVVTADANIATSADFLFSPPITPIPVYNVNKELHIKARSAASMSPEARNSFWTPIRRSKCPRQSPLSRGRPSKSISLDLKMPPALLSTLRTDSLSRFQQTRTMQSTEKRALKPLTAWLVDSRVGRLTGYSMLKKQRLRRKGRGYRKSQETYSELLYGDDLLNSGKCLS